MRKISVLFLFVALLFGESVVSDNYYATEAGLKILKEGGNAVDAAVAVGFALAVTYPSAGNIGGGGFMVIWDGKKAYFLDYRETAPASATRNMYIENGNFSREKALIGALAAGVPGTVAGLLEAHRIFGKLPLEKVLEPAISLAEKGFRLSSFQEKRFYKKRDVLSRFPETAKIFLPGGKPPVSGQIIVQKDLAKTLKLIAKKGKDGFYRGRTARLIIRTMKKYGGLITYQDLINYSPKWRAPEIINYAGRKVFVSSLPSSGGLILRTILSIMEKSKLHTPTPIYYHTLVEAMRLAFFDRAKFMGDPDFARVPVKGIRSEIYLREKIERIKLFKPIPLTKFDFNPFKHESTETTHFSVFDGKIAVSNTYTINSLFGCGLVVEGAGFLLNNEMDDFSTPGFANQFGAIGSEANYIEGGKRMLSSQTPTIVVNDGKVEAILGAPGGTTIPNSVVQVILNIYQLGMTPWEAVYTQRLHHQWMPDTLFAERGFSRTILDFLKNEGFSIKLRTRIGDVNGIYLWKGKYIPIADPRADGRAGTI